MLEAQLLSKVIDENKFEVLKNYNVELTDFSTLGEAFLFVRDYAKENGQSPDYRTVVAQFEDFEYYPEVADSFKYLCKQLKAQTAKRQSFELLQNKASKKFSELSGDKFVEWLEEETARIKSTTQIRFDLGTNFATNGDERLAWYNEAKENIDRLFIPSPYSSLTKFLGGGFEIGDYILLMAFTNRGKSWVASDIGRVAWENEFGVLHYSPELSKRQQMHRLDTLLGHFNNVQLRRGALSNEEQYKSYLTAFKDVRTPYIVKTMEDLPQGLTVETIEADLQMNPNVQLVIIDGFNLMVHKGKDGNRNNMTNTSRRLRQLFGRYQVAGLVVHQTTGSAEKENRQEDDDGNRVVSPPKLTMYSETVAVIQDASTALTFDACQGVGKISIEKAREPHVGEVIELAIDFNMGYINEQDATSYF